MTRRAPRPVSPRAASPRNGTGLAAFAVAGVLLIVLPFASGAKAAGDPLARFRTLPADSTAAREAVVAENPGAFARAVDSVLVFGDPGDTGAPAFLREAAERHLAATGDSLLMWDLGFAAPRDPVTRRAWWRGVEADAQGFVLRKQGDHEGSAARFREAAEAYAAVGHLRREAVAWGALGVSLWNLGDWAATREAYLKALETRKRLGDPVLIGRTLNALGSTAMRLGDFPEALRYYDEARAVRETLGNAADLATTIAYIGNVHYLLGDLVEARASYTRSLEVFGPDAPPGQLRYSFMGLAGVHLALGEYEASLDLYRRAQGLAEATGDAANAMVCRQNVGEILRILGDHAGALRELNAAKDIQEQTGDRFNLAATWHVIGDVYSDQGDDSQSLRAQETAARLARETGNQKALGEALEGVGYIYLRMSLPDRAEATFEEARAVYTAGGFAGEEASVLSKLAHVHAAKGEPDSALVLFEAALAAEDRLGLRAAAAGERGNIGNLLAGEGHLSEARDAYSLCAGEAALLGRPDVLWPCLLGMADAFEQAGTLDSARVYNTKAIEVMESMRGNALSEETRAAFLAQRAFVYEAQVHVLAKLTAARGGGFAEEAFTVAERGKAQALLDLLTEGRLDLEAGMDPVLAAERDSLERAMNGVRYRVRLASDSGAPADTLRALRKSLQALESDYAARGERLRLADPRLAGLEGESAPSLDDLRRVLLGGKGRVLVSYELGDSASYAWVITAKDVAMFRLPVRSVVEAEVQKLRSALTSAESAGDASYLDAATALYRMVVAPLRGALGSARTVYMVPDGALQFIPFDVLLERDPGSVPADPQARNRFFTELPYAFRDADLCYGPSARVLAVLASTPRTGSPPPEDFLGVGDPVFRAPGADSTTASRGAAGLAALPGTRLEVTEIARLFPHARTLLGEDAAEGTLTAPGFLSSFRIVHFATHGLVDERHPENSSLALSAPKDPGSDGYLQAREIFGLDLRADLVVLSACETGLGKMVRGEGVMGLPRAFFHAGAPRVVVSLWSVSDRSTAELMTLFYGRLQKEKESPARALARAKADLRKGVAFAHPFYWAPFVLLGPA